MPAGVLYDKSMSDLSGIADNPSLSAALATMPAVPSIPSAIPSPVQRPICANTFDGEAMPSIPLTLLVIPLATSDTASLTAFTLLLIPLIKPSITSLPICNKSISFNGLIILSFTPYIFSSVVVFNSSHFAIASSFKPTTISTTAVFISFHLSLIAVLVCDTIFITPSFNCVHKFEAVSFIADHVPVRIDLAPSHRLCIFEINPSTSAPTTSLIAPHVDDAMSLILPHICDKVSRNPSKSPVSS